jgi:hypothetical protein
MDREREAIDAPPSPVHDGSINKKGGRSRPFFPIEPSYTINGTMSSATMLMILMSGFTAGPAVSL